MDKPPIATIVNFCTNESRFLPFCLEEVHRFSQQVIVPVCDHFFDGTVENRPLLEAIYAAFPECQFIEYPYMPERLPKKVFQMIKPASFWHSLSRFLGALHVREDIETVFFLDADEIPEGQRCLEWFECSDYLLHTVMRLANYWYFREPRYRADRWEDSIVLVQKKSLEPSLLLHQEERDIIYRSLPEPKRRMVVGVDGMPLFHHYSWVRTQEEMLRKVRSWSHRLDRDWVPLVQREFSGPFQGVDFVHGYRFETVEPRFPIALELPQFSPKGRGSRVIKLGPSDVLKTLQRGLGSSVWDSLLSFFHR